jgi:hypothetical protein
VATAIRRHPGRARASRRVVVLGAFGAAAAGAVGAVILLGPAVSPARAPEPAAAAVTPAEITPEPAVMAASAPVATVQVPVHLETTPRGARVLAAGREIARTPCDVQVAADGTLEVELQMPGHAIEKLTLDPRVHRSLSVELRPAIRRPRQPSATSARPAPRPTTDPLKEPWSP